MKQTNGQTIAFEKTEPPKTETMVKCSSLVLEHEQPLLKDFSAIAVEIEGKNYLINPNMNVTSNAKVVRDQQNNSMIGFRAVSGG